MKTKTFYRLVTPPSFSDQDFATLEEAQEAFDKWGTVSKLSAYFQYWQDQKAQCHIEKITQKSEVI